MLEISEILMEKSLYRQFTNGTKSLFTNQKFVHNLMIQDKETKY